MLKIAIFFLFLKLLGALTPDTNRGVGAENLSGQVGTVLFLLLYDVAALHSNCHSPGLLAALLNGKNSCYICT